ncbi:MAG: tetratricopeptide repeat protein [Proteobacteria bacterium]|nr:tetratricopeptide repeat protein [Pseudomonadota bacterium]
MPLRKLLVSTVLAAGLMTLAACESSEERAEKFYQSGMNYLEEGDVDRALVEFRNVFKLNGEHKEARRAYARVERDRGRLREAFSQYLRLVEQYPEEIEAMQALAEMAVANGDWEVAERYATPAVKLQPENNALLAVKAAADYGLANQQNDAARIVDALKRINELRKADPKNILLRRVVIDDLLRAQDFQDALTEIDAAIELEPRDRQLFAQRMAVLSALGDDAGVEAGLIDMVARFPEAAEMSETLVRWYLSRDEFDKAEAHLRSRIDMKSPDVNRIFALVRFLAEHRGAKIAVGELDKAIAAGANAPIYLSARAGFLFDLGQREEAITAMREVLKAESNPDDSRRMKIGLARMLTSAGQPDEARKLVDEVLAEDSGAVEALKLKATWQIQDDQTGDAISTLRRAIDGNPGDASLLTLLAQAYERDGNRDLMRETLSLAVNASNRAPDESLRYAQLLASENKLVQAEGVIIDALRLSPNNLGLLVPLGQIYVAMQDWPRADGVVSLLEESKDANGRAAAIALKSTALNGQQKSDEAIGYLQSLAKDGQADIGTKVAIIRTHVANRQIDRALAFANEMLEQEPDNPEVQFIQGSVQALAGNTADAESTMRQLVEEDPARIQAWLSLVRIVANDPNRSEETGKLIDEALNAAPDVPELKWAKAGLLERNADFAGAIAIYEALYKENSGNPIIANNLASLLSMHGTDPDSLNRADLIARRLRDSTVPAFQDTYGWIAYLRGNFADAEANLVKAAAGLTEDPSVQYHLAMAYLAREKRSEALLQFKKMFALLPKEGPQPDFARTARQEMDKLEAAGVTVGN